MNIGYGGDIFTDKGGCSSGVDGVGVIVREMCHDIAHEFCDGRIL